MREWALQSLPGWCAGPGLQWHHLPPRGSLQTPNRCGCVHLVFYSLTRKWFACHPQPQGATEGPSMWKAQDWSSIWLSTPLSLLLNPTTADGLKCKEPWCVYEHMCHLFIFRLPTAFMSIWDKCLNFVNIVHFVYQGIKVLSVTLQALSCKRTCQSMIQAPGIACSATGNFLPEAHLLVEGQQMHTWKDTRRFMHAKWFLNTVVNAAEDPRKKDYQTFQSGPQFSQNISLLNQEI